MTDEEQAMLERMLRRARRAASLVAHGNPDPRILADARALFQQLRLAADRFDGGREWLTPQLRDAGQPLIRPGILDQIGRADEGG
jgi:hypothetical protein